MFSIKISGTGIYTPSKMIPTSSINEMVGEDITHWAVDKMGIEVKKISDPEEAASDLAVKASRQALQKAGLNPTDLDLVIVATDTPDYLSPATSSVLQCKLGAKNAGTFDVNCACAGFVTALDTATKYLLTDKSYKRALVVGTYAMTKFMNWKDKVTAPIFSDGAGAVIIEQTEEGPGYLASKIIADGCFYDYLGVYLGSGAVPTPEYIEKGLHLVRYNKRYPDVNTENWPILVRDTLKKADLYPEDIDMILYTQVRKYTIEEVMKSLNLPMEKTYMVMGKYGYTGSACIPMALYDALEEGKINKGDIVVFCSSGGGYAMAAYVMKWV